MGNSSSRQNPSESDIGKCTHVNKPGKFTRSISVGDLVDDPLVENDVVSNKKIDSSGSTVYYEQDIGFSDSNVMNSDTCSSHSKYDTPEKSLFSEKNITARNYYQDFSTTNMRSLAQ